MRYYAHRIATKPLEKCGLKAFGLFGPFRTQMCFILSIVGQEVRQFHHLILNPGEIALVRIPRNIFAVAGEFFRNAGVYCDGFWPLL